MGKATSTNTRRAFLKAGVGALTAPAFVPAAALGRDGFVAPSERVTMGFIGVGGQGRGHLLGGAWTYLTGGYTAREDVQVLAICDAWRNRREEARARVEEYYAGRRGAGSYTACQACADFREVLAREDVDAVLIATPVHWHGVMATLAARAGKDIYCEKPTAITIRESQTIRDAVRRYGVVYQAGTQQRSEYGAKFRHACEIVRRGGLGQLREVFAFRPGGTFAWRRFGAPQPVPDGLDWDRYLGPAPWQPYAGVAHGHMFCGIGDINWGPHHYDFIQWVLDADRTGPVAIEVTGDVLHYHYANGVVVHGYPPPEGGPGGSGGARFVGTAGWVAADRDSIQAQPASLLTEVAPPVPGVRRCASHSGNFLECVRTRQQPICDAETAHRAASVVLLGGLALTLQRSLKWDPARERFDGDDEANRLLAAAYRSPWQI